jgi:two-component system, chemotaxis family, response regulator Rcp1
MACQIEFLKSEYAMLNDTSEPFSQGNHRHGNQELGALDRRVVSSECGEPLMSPDTTEPIEILLVEDTESDAERTLAALREGRVRNRVIWVQDGEQAIQYLHRMGTFARARRPDLILLDWWLPKIKGEEVLAYVKQHAEFKQIPVIILTQSAEDADILKAYTGHANCYVTKPVAADAFIAAVRSIENFWLSVVKLPTAA